MTAHEITQAIFPYLRYPGGNLSKHQVASFIKMHGRDFFSIYLRRDDPRLIVNVYCMKPDNGVEQNG